MALGQPNPPRGEAFTDPRFAAGTQLGKYELIAPIGSGGMASVILARTRGPGGFEKVVVIKVVHPHMASDEIAVSMLLDEGRLAALIEHPNVVHTYEVGEAFGTFYIVMEYLAGESLHTVIRQSIQPSSGAFHPTLAGKIVSDACEGLHAAHELTDFNGVNRQIVHRDVSPGNIVVLYNGQVKVVDFGIAKAQGRATETQVGELKGKYGYMSPEQINNEPMDRRSDVFSLGVTLWEALAKRRLFHQENIGATLMQILRGPRVPPSTYDREVPKALDEIAQKALQPDPRDRFQSAGEMKKAIDDAIWQARVGTSDVQKYMHSIFTQRMEARRQLLAAATDSSLDEVIDLLTRERSAVQVPEELLPQHTPPPHRGSQPMSHRTPAPVRHSSGPIMQYPAQDADSQRVSYPPQSMVSGRGSYPQMAPGSQRISHQPGSLVVGPNGQHIFQAEPGSSPGWMPPGMQHAYPGQMPLTGSRVIEERSRWRFYAIVATTLLVGIVGTILAFTALSSSSSETVAPPPKPSKPRTTILSPEDLNAIQPTPPPSTVPKTLEPTVPTNTTPTPPGPEVAPPQAGTSPPPNAKVTPDAATKIVEPPPTPVPPTGGTKPKPPGPSTKKDPGEKGTPTKRDPDEDVTVDDGGSETPSGDEKELKQKAAAYYAAGNWDKAEDSYKKVLEINPRYAPAHRGLGLIYQRRKMVKAAIKSYKRYLELQPKAHDAKDIKERLRQLGDE